MRTCNESGVGAGGTSSGGDPDCPIALTPAASAALVAAAVSGGASAEPSNARRTWSTSGSAARLCSFVLHITRASRVNGRAVGYWLPPGPSCAQAPRWSLAEWLEGQSVISVINVIIIISGSSLVVRANSGYWQSDLPQASPSGLTALAA